MALLHSWLFLPITNTRFINKIQSLNADIYVLDLEDSVYKDRKYEAQNLIKSILPTLNNQNIAIRINHLSTDWGEVDLELCFVNKVKSVIYPKLNSVSELRELIQLIGHFSNKYQHDIEIIPALETLKGVYESKNILKEDSFKYFIFGSEDYMADFGLSRKFTNNNPILSKTIVDLAILAVLNKKYFIDCANPYYRTENDIESFKQECEYSASIGAIGKAVIHPDQLDIVNLIFNGQALKINNRLLKKIKKVVGIMKNSQESIIEFEGRMFGLPELKNILNQVERESDHSKYVGLTAKEIKELILQVI